MWLLDTAVIAAGWIAYLLLFWRCQREHHWSRYPFFVIYLVITFLRTAAIGLFRDIDPRFYSVLYWYSDVLVVFLRFCVAWEILRHTFPAGTVVRAIAVRVLLALSAVLVIVLYFFVTPQGDFYLDVERKLGLAVVAWLVVLLLLARSYALPFGRNIWGMAGGRGLYASIAVANFSAVDLKSSFASIWRLLTPCSYSLMLLIWTWALWSYTPAPQLQPLSGPSLDAAQAGWQQSWRKISAAIRKGLGR